MRDLRLGVSKLKSLEALSKDALVKVYRGDSEVLALRKKAFESLNRGDTYYIIGASGERYYQIVGNEIEKIEKKE